MGFAFQMGGVGAMATFGGDATLSNEFTITLAGKTFGLFGMKGFFLTAIALFVIGKIAGNRVSVEDELTGLDMPEMGVLAYPTTHRSTR